MNFLELVNIREVREGLVDGGRDGGRVIRMMVLGIWRNLEVCLECGMGVREWVMKKNKGCDKDSFKV